MTEKLKTKITSPRSLRRAFHRERNTRNPMPETIRIPETKKQYVILEAIRRFGGNTKLGLALGVSPQTSRIWALKGEIPYRYYYQLERLITPLDWPEDLKRDIFDCVLNVRTYQYRWHNNIRQGKKDLPMEVADWMAAQGGTSGLAKTLKEMHKDVKPEYLAELGFKFDAKSLWSYFYHPTSSVPIPLEETLIKSLNYPRMEDDEARAEKRAAYHAAEDKKLNDLIEGWEK